MTRTMLFSIAVLGGLLGWSSTSQAQVFIRAPFVRVIVGGDGSVGVRAPFVDFYAPPAGSPVYYGPRYGPAYGPNYGPSSIVPPGPITPAPSSDKPFVPPMPSPVTPKQAAANPIDKAEPQPLQPAAAPTLDAFSKSFRAKAGSYEVMLLNPVTKQPTTVRFTLPEGTPRRVVVRGQEIEFIYGLRQFVRIEFDRDGATVISR